MKNILCVDDEDELLEIIAATFADEGFVVDTASSGNQGIDKMKSKKYDAVLSDIKMPDGTGIDLLKYAMTLDSSSRPKIFLLTGYSDYTERDVLKLGCSGLFRKPGDLLGIIDKVLKQLGQG